VTLIEFTPIFALLAAPFVGSFLGVLVLRLPLGAPVVFGRSRCQHCHVDLSPIDLLPLLSWIANQGACRHCGAKLGCFYPAIEAAALLVAISVLVVVPPGAEWTILLSLLLGWTLLALAWIDAKYFLLPDALTMPLIGLGLMAAWLLTPEDFLGHVIGMIAGYAVFALIALIYRRVRGREGLGMGDAKLLAVAGAWLSWSGLPSVLFLASAGALAVAVASGVMRSSHRLTLQDKLPFGPALAAAIWLVWLCGPVEFNLW